ncbi:MAG TPA: VOC family protein [Candidatus Kryptonia bacterium]
MSDNYPGVIPMVAYEDGPAALDWLARAFGFKERTRHFAPDGRMDHGEMDTGSGVIMLATPTRDYESPRHHREHCDTARTWATVPWIVDGVLVYVEDVDAHYRRAKQESARILTEPEGDFPGRRYRVEDIEGHRWMFMEREKK